MESPLQLLRELLPFRHAPADGENAAFQGRLATLAGLAPFEIVEKLAAKVLPDILGQGNLHMRFKMLEEARIEAEQALPTLEQHLTQADLPLPKSAALAALHADNLLKGMAHAYAGIARNIEQNQQHAALVHLLHRSVLRAITMLSRRQLLAYRAYAMPSPASWQMLHELYRLTCAPSGMPLNGETGPIEHAYLGALLFAFLEPNKLPRNELDMIHRCTDQLSAYAIVGEATPEARSSKSAESCFLVNPDQGSPGHPLTRLPAGIVLAGGLIVDCSQVLTALDRNLSRLPGMPVEPKLDAPPVLLQSLRVAIGGKSARRFSRTKFKPRADLIGGLDQVITFLDGNTFSRRSLDAICRHESRTFKSSEWSLVDESPDGFRIRFIKGEKWNIAAGDVVALQPRESSRIHVCLVRRIATSQNRLELGLQLLSPQVSIISLPNGGDRHLHALFLHSLPAYGKFSGLIVPPGKLAPGQQIAFNTLGRTLHRQIGKCIEANEGLEFVALDPLPD